MRPFAIRRGAERRQVASDPEAPLATGDRVSFLDGIGS